jgi:RNA polymerase sigma-70 factor (ECF subfamily)
MLPVMLRAGAQEVEEAVRRHLGLGDHAAAASDALRGYGPQILGYLAAILSNDALATEAFSAFAEDLWCGLPSFRGEGTVRAWAYAVASRCASRTLRTAARDRTRRLMTSEASRLAEEVRTSLPTRVERRDRIARARAQLQPEEQALLVLRIDRDLSWAEVAAALSEMSSTPVNEAAVRKRFERLRQRLRELLAAEPAR